MRRRKGSRTPASSGRTRGFRSWRCPTASTRCSRWPPRRGRASRRPPTTSGAFAPTADEVRDEVLRAFPGADITYQVDQKRQGIVDSWPEDVDDGAARADWGFAPRHDFASAFREYLIPTIRGRYSRRTRLSFARDFVERPDVLGDQMPKLTVEGVGTFDVADNKRLVLALEEDAQIDQLHACGGRARCTTCRVEFIAGEPDA